MLPLVLWTAVLGQSASTIAGAAMGPNNQPVGQALIFISDGPADDGSVPAVGQGMTDAQGRYRLEVGKRAPTRTLPLHWPAVLAYRAGMAISANSLGPQAVGGDPHGFQLALEPAVKRTLNFADRAGRPLAGLRVTPFRIAPSARRSPSMAIPDVLAERLAVTTDAKGQAVLDCLAAKYGLQAARVTLPGGASHVVEVPFASYTASPLSFVLEPGGRLAGRVLTEDGKPAAGVEVEVSPDLIPRGLATLPVRFAGGPIRARDDGSFRTPPGLLVGERYRVLVKAEAWQQKPAPVVTLSADPNTTTSYPDIVLAPKRALAGRVVDRQGRAVADAEIFANSFAEDDLEVLATHRVLSKARSQSQGQFRVTGLAPQGGAVLVVRAKGFRIFGRALKEHETKDIQVVLSRPDEFPAPTMTTLPGPLPDAERRKLARQVLEPFLEKALAEGNDREKFSAIRWLSEIDPDAALALADKTTFAAQEVLQQDYLRQEVVLTLARAEPERAVAIAHGIKDPEPRSEALLDVSWYLPADEVERKKELLSQAITAAHEVARAQMQIFLLAQAAVLLMDCGEEEQARALAGEVRAGLEKVANPVKSRLTAVALSQLARVDLPAALAIVENQVALADRPAAHGNIAVRIAASDPAEAERLLDTVKTRLRASFVGRTCYRMAPVDLPRAKKILLAQYDGQGRATWLAFLASALPPKQRATARALVLEALAELDRTQGEEEDQLLRLLPYLPALEQIDPALVPEWFWRIFTRPSRLLSDMRGLARYEPDVAATVYPTELLTKILTTKGGNNTPSWGSLRGIALLELAARDPKLAVQLATPDSDPPATSLSDAMLARADLLEFLGRASATRWDYRLSPYSRLDPPPSHDSYLQE